MTNRVLAVAMLLVVAACGGGKKDGGNPAANATFTYSGTPQPGPMPAGTSTAISSALTFKSTASASSATGASDALFAAAEAALATGGGGAGVFATLPAEAVPLVRATQRRALGPIDGGSAQVTGLPPGCYTEQPGSKVTFSGCKIVESTYTGSFSITLDGFVQVVGDTVSWDLLITLNGSDEGVTFAATYDDSGNLTVTAASATGHQEVSLTANASSGGQSAALGVAQAADLNVTLAPVETCATRIVDGTFEAKRIWFMLPGELKGDPDFRNMGVKFDWNGCGTGTFQVSST